MHPLTDIIVLVHNRLEVTKEFVKRLFGSTDNFHLIFFNNGSDETTSDYLKHGSEKGRWSLLTSAKNLGIVEPRNIAAEKVKADYFVNLDNDQYPRTGWLQQLHDLINLGFDVAGCEAWRLHPPNKGGHVVLHTKPYTMDYFPYKRCTRISDSFTYIGCGGMLIKTQVYKDVGLFDLRFSPAYFEDPDFTFKLIQKNYKLGWKPDCPIDHLGHQTITTQSLFNKNEQFIKSWSKFRDKWNPYYPNLIKMHYGKI